MGKKLTHGRIAAQYKHQHTQYCMWCGRRTHSIYYVQNVTITCSGNRQLWHIHTHCLRKALYMLQRIEKCYYKVTNYNHWPLVPFRQYAATKVTTKK